MKPEWTRPIQMRASFMEHGAMILKISMETRFLALSGLVMAIALVGCGSSEPDDVEGGGSALLMSDDEFDDIRTVNYPLWFFANRIGGDIVPVHFDAPDGDPAFWQPDASMIATFQQSDLILLNGADYAKWTKHASLPRSKCVNTSESFEDQYIFYEEAVTHSHGTEGEHAHEGTAFTTWLDPLLAMRQASAIRDAMNQRLPEQKEMFDLGYESLARDLRRLDESLTDVAAEIGDRPIIGSHPVYQYLARRYALNIRSVHWEPDAEPSAEQWAELDELLAEHPATVMIWEGDPLGSVAEALNARGIRSFVVDPCGNRPAQGDWIAVMIDNTAALRSLSAARQP